jgi:excisionase family DNA binding protein
MSNDGVRHETTPGHATRALETRLTVTVPEAGRMIGISRNAAYAAVARGDIPSIRIGRKVLVPRRRLLEMLGTASEEAPAA